MLHGSPSDEGTRKSTLYMKAPIQQKKKLSIDFINLIVTVTHNKYK